MKYAYQLYIISKILTAQAKFSGLIVTYQARFVKNKKFRNAVNKAIQLGYLGQQKNGKGDHHNFAHVNWLGQPTTFSYDQGTAKGRKGEVDRSYVDHLIMLCAKVKTILDQANKHNVKLPLKNQQDRNMTLAEYEKSFNITKDMAQANVKIVQNQLLGK